MVFCGRCMEKLGEDPVCPHCGHDNREVQDIPYALKPGTILNGKYLIGNVLGQGGFGITYVGFDLALEIRVAIKEYYVAGSASRMDGKSQAVYWAQKPDHMDHFIKEARRMAKLENMPEVAHVRDVFYANNTAYIIMEFVKGDSLKHHLQKNGTMSYEQTVKLMLPVIHALGRVHDENIIHRDITPDNLMMEPAGKLRVLDLGAAGDMTQNNGQASQLVARHGFSPYEQYLEKGKIGPWTDVYSVCATICYCCTGRVIPNAYDRVDQYMTTHNSEIEIDPVIPAAGVEVLQKGLALNTENRIQNMQELAAQLEESLLPPKAASSAGNAAPKKASTKQPAVPTVKPAPEVQKMGNHTRSQKMVQKEPVKKTPERKKTEDRKTKPHAKKTGLIIAAAVLVLVLAVAVFGKSGWHRNKDGQRQYYRFGMPAKGWVKVDEERYYFSDDGILMTGWQEIDGQQYYFANTDGAMCMGWQVIGNHKYYFGSDGAVQTGWQTIGEDRYYFEHNGAMCTQWQQIDGNRFYFSDDGVMCTDWQVISGKKYYFDSDGIMCTGWVTWSGKTYCFGNNGIMRTLWQTIDGSIYYFGSDGVMRTGWTRMNGDTYYFGDDGVMRTGWVTISGIRYHFDENGVYQD